jgi:hypothetical protein
VAKQERAIADDDHSRAEAFCDQEKYEEAIAMRGPTYAILVGAWLLIVGPLSILAPGTTCLLPKRI